MQHGKAVVIKAIVESSYGPGRAELYRKFPQKGNYDEPTIKALLHPFPRRSKEWLDFAKTISRSVHGPSESDIYRYFGYDSAIPLQIPLLTPDSSAADPA